MDAGEQRAQLVRVGGFELGQAVADDPRPMAVVLAGGTVGVGVQRRADGRRVERRERAIPAVAGAM
jgi:hypothetical protein